MSALTLTVGGRPWPVVIPTDFSLIEELVVAGVGVSDVIRARVSAAMVAACCPALGRKFALLHPRQSYAAHGYDPVAFGRGVYTWLHAEGATHAELGTAYALLLPLLTAAGFPRDEEVQDEAGKSAGPEAL